MVLLNGQYGSTKDGMWSLVCWLPPHALWCSVLQLISEQESHAIERPSSEASSWTSLTGFSQRCCYRAWVRVSIAGSTS